ncbi:MAG: hypothetical protein B6U88_02005 [Candidatus Aenigmarchaeota archaeon ex4484_56]|nr:MAG: hypothetical protein B6U88_02005 [Candidatus Aenigmarchaeota archaeon ex4484_56]
MQFACKIYKGEEILLAVCDKDLLGKKLKYNNFIFEIKESFYFDKFVDENEIKSLLKEATIINLVGNNIAKLAEKLKYIQKKDIIIIEGIAHVQIYKI